ncbi:DUF72 domain-containing protein [Rhizobacter sp. LjRoot28]|uniref:DUF72 domain-containing protein n=1 Tax=Rhizobacter sp. LjRoot28 TaxID=3342309 RepID=UPI003ECCA392
MAIRIGTASWTDKTLIACGRFYPRGAGTAEGRLRHYASVFPLVELDSSYYAIPSAANAARWAERTPDGFTMNVKAFRLFTGHQTPVNVLHGDIRAALGPAAPATFFYKDMPPELRDELWRRFIDALVPLKAAGRLGLVHFQFPPWVRESPAARAHVAHCVERLQGHYVSVEFRHASWFAEPRKAATLAFERELGVAHTVVDEPQGFDNSVPAVWELTHPRFALVRLHGRNAATWNIRGEVAASDRFNYDYPEDELRGLAVPIRQLSQKAAFTHVIFNNNMEDQGQRNALTLMGLLGLGGNSGLC